MKYNYIEIQDFISIKDNQNILTRILNMESNFKDAMTIAFDDSLYAKWRRAKKADGYIDDFSQILQYDILNIFNDICSVLEIEEFSIDRLEVQITSHNDGDYYKIHTDNDADDFKNRIITFVYYVHSIPKKFEGGELYLWGDTPTIIEPTNNKIIFFNSSLKHEVKPVVCKDKSFRNSRFTLNGWIWKKE